MATNNSETTNELQIRQLIDGWAGAIRNKNIEAAVSHYARDILLYDLAPPLGRGGGRPTVEQALRLDIDDMMRWGRIRAGSHLAGEMRFNFYDDQIDLKFESRVGDPWDSWLRLRYSMTDYCSGEELKIDDKVYLAPTRPHFGGLRWWFVCPNNQTKLRNQMRRRTVATARHCRRGPARAYLAIRDGWPCPVIREKSQSRAQNDSLSLSPGS